MRTERGLHRGPFGGAVVQRDPAGRPTAIGRVVDGEYRIRFPELATFAFRPATTEVRVEAAPSTPPEQVEALLQTTVLPFKLQAEGCEALHASAVRTRTGIVAFCGYSGIGKTTVAVGLARRGHEAWADDAVVFTISDTDDRVISRRLPHGSNLRPDSLRFFGDNRRVVTASTPDERLAAIVALEGDADRRSGARLAPLTLDAAFRTVLPHAYCFFAEEGGARRTAVACLDLVARVPVFTFRLPAGFTRLEAALDDLERGLGIAPPSA